LIIIIIFYHFKDGKSHFKKNLLKKLFICVSVCICDAILAFNRKYIFFQKKNCSIKTENKKKSFSPGPLLKALKQHYHK